MKNKVWNETIKNNFNNASATYLGYSNIQRHFAKKIVSFLKELNIQKGEWLDLGSGTGLLAEEIEKKFPSQKITRVDFSKKMLLQNKESSKKILWDLNTGLPPSIRNSPLMTSNFCIHWLDNPEKIMIDWFSKLSPGGYLIISYPTINSFPEWKQTCIDNNIEYSGLTFPVSKDIIKSFHSDEIFFSNEYLYVENFPDVYKLFRSIVNVGAQSTRCERKTVNELRKMQKFWPKIETNRVNLTWKINIQILKKS
ncbi:Methylase involved in ubiquinone/menaquinone biosynthesis [Prochlorococcus marinus str. MIT 9515]|uniref:Methylase involved in ubiquinone/menaquinone biosynthesis n=1 Tax=Prochlorococcus marinus (strain MIT 9515) TaxID=167542 RepID=A2BYJ6_PROM5|nr:methyltransferase domain-containing protein [Prochlorococcus marinus]ABM72857.1 Methylase involved in ubiquinone/menaquinone biosynthesis [Prochlorococcus marinus str. MIT 9515]